MATKTITEELVQEVLQPGEQLCWQSKTVPFKLMENDSRKSLLLRWIGGVVGIATIIALFLAGGRNGKLGFVAIIIGLLLIMMVAPLFELHKVRKYSYFLTDRRAIVLGGNGIVYSMGLEYVDDAWVLHGQTAGDCLVLGSAMMRDLHKQLRWLTCHPRINTINLENGLGMGMVFYSIENAEEAKACLHKA